MFKQQKPKRFKYKSQSLSDNDKKVSGLKKGFEELKRQPKKSNAKVSTVVVLLGLLFAVFVIMYMLESKMN